MSVHEESLEHSRWLLPLLSSVVFMAVVSGTMINVGLPYIGTDFGVSEGTYGWIVTGYTLTFGIFSAINGRLADVFGIKNLYLVGVFLFGTTSLVVAMSPNIETAIALRLFQGAGAAAMPVLGSTIIARVYPSHERGKAMGVILSVVGVAASIGPFLGGILVQLFDWRAIFVFTGLVLPAIFGGMRWIPERLNERAKAGFDFVGATLLGVAVALTMYGFEILENAHGISQALVVNLGVALAFHVAFFVWIHRARSPFVTPEVLLNLRYLAVAFVAFLSNATRFGSIVLVPIFLSEVNHVEPAMVGAVLLPGAVAIALLSTKAGAAADRFGPRAPVAFGMSFIVFGNLVTAYFAGGSLLGVAVGMGLYGVGFAMIQTPCVSAVSQIVPKSQIGVGTGMFMMIFFIGGAVGVATSMTALEFQAVDAVSWLGLELGAGARFSNALLLLTVMALVGLGFLPALPSRATLDAAKLSGLDQR